MNKCSSKPQDLNFSAILNSVLVWNGLDSIFRLESFHSNAQNFEIFAENFLKNDFQTLRKYMFTIIF